MVKYETLMHDAGYTIRKVFIVLIILEHGSCIMYQFF